MSGSFPEIIGKVKELGFGGFLFGYLALLVFLKSPDLFPDGTIAEQVFFIFSALGALITRAIGTLVRPATKYLTLCWKMYELDLFLDSRWGRQIDSDTGRSIFHDLVRDYFLEKDRE